jgi:hypothetical protein
MMFSLVFVHSVIADDIIDPDDIYRKDTNKTDNNITKRFEQFEGRVYILAKPSPGSDLFLYGAPNGKLFREFEIHMFANEHAYYQIKLDNQTLEVGQFDFFKKTTAESPYNVITVEVILKNETDITLPVFKFANLKLIDLGEPTEKEEEEEEEPSPIIEPYRKIFTPSEWNIHLATRMISLIGLTVLGYLVGSSLAIIKMDLQGAERRL